MPDMERKKRLERELSRIVGVLAGMGAKKIILFGSLAQGQIGPCSDIDLIVVRETTKSFSERLGELYGALLPRVALDVLAYTPEEFEEIRDRPFIREALAEGKVLHEE